MSYSGDKSNTFYNGPNKNKTNMMLMDERTRVRKAMD